MSVETAEIRLKRLKMRSWRRGMKEMDLILGGFSDDSLSKLSDPQLVIYERLLEENDQELYLWFSSHIDAPTAYRDLIQVINKAQNIVKTT